MPTLLVTAFEPFGGRMENASALAAAAMPARVGQWQLCKAVLPVTFGGAGERAVALARQLRPDAILLLGQAGGRTQITPELVAINWQYARIPDNAGAAPMDQPVLEGAGEARFATLPVRAMARAMTAGGYPAAVSYSAGAYVCNDLYFRVLYALPRIPTAFVHVPEKEVLDPALAARALELAIAALPIGGGDRI